MAVELHFEKSDQKIPWGFRLAGGSDFDVPLTVIKVTTGSLAENAGMQVGDVVVRINDTAISPMTHVQAHDVIISSGTDFVIGVRRGDLSNLPSRLLLYDSTVENNGDPKVEVFGTKQSVNDSDLNITDEEIATIIGEHVQFSQKKETFSTQNAQVVQKYEANEEVIEERMEQRVEISQEASIQQSEVAKVIIDDQCQQDKKWSTFLQKPVNPKPKPKPKEVEDPKVPPYRVIIKKQPKKGEVPLKENIKISDDINNNEPEEQFETDNDVHAENGVLGNFEEQENSDIDEALQEEEDTIKASPKEELLEDTAEEYEHASNHEQVDDEDELIRQSLSEKKLSVNLEEQLAEVQKQLLALSQLPSTIQQTLNAVTRQLSELVAASQQELSIETNVRIEEEESIEERTESVEYHEQALSILEEASCEEEETGQVTFEDIARTESEDEQAIFEALERECEQSEMESQIMTEEELEAYQLEQEKLEKKEKDSRRGSSSHPLTPLERPIILPGGRKWSAPNDVVSKLRKPSLTDERIAKTISTYTEVISGRTMGINFLKYQPPPKNLDYLQKSSVYRLIHDIEPPAKGIVARDIKVLSEHDYYGQMEVSSSSADLV